MDDKKLFLLDAYALIYRAYYALINAPRTTTAGMNTSAIFGFCNTLDEILRKENPSHIAVCFDPPHGITFRHEAYPEYKAQRDAQPEDITLSIPYIKRILEAYRIPAIEVERYEADDVIGTLARKAEAEGFITYMMTPDKDYGQLVDDRIYMYRPALKGQGFEIRGPKEICERYGISSPRQVIDLLALEGDASDNIPGCPGVGEKTAVKLIGEWGSVENLLDNTDKLKGALQRKVVENVDKIRFSKFLATIKTDVPLDIRLEDLRRRDEDVEALREVYKELEFRTFIAKLGAKKTSVPEVVEKVTPGGGMLMGSLFDLPVEDSPAATPVSGSVKCRIIPGRDLMAAGRLVEDARGKSVGICLNASGADSMTARLEGIAIATASDEAAYINLLPLEGSEREELMALLEPLFTTGSSLIISHEMKRDYLLLKREHINIAARMADTAVAHYLLEPEKRHRFSDVALNVLNHPTLESADEPRTRRQEIEPIEPPLAAEQAALLLPLHDRLLEMLERESLKHLYDDIEMPMVTVLAEMEWTGVRVDTAELNRLAAEFAHRLEGMEHQVYEMAGTTFNIGSPMQVGEVLFERMKIDPKAKRTKRGTYSTTEEVLDKYKNDYPIVDLILKIRGLKKLLTTYVTALPEMINPTTGKIHTTFNQTVTATGRLSSTNPNLQNIPIRTDDGREIRRAFIADEGCLLLSADYSQIELRLMAEMSGDPDMVEAFASGADIHRSTAARLYHKKPDEVTDTERRNAKTANFGIIYGISAFGLSERLGIPRSAAKALIDGYFATYPQIRAYIDNSINTAREKGYVSTVMGRKRFLPDINSRNAVVRGYAERNAVNAPLQGSAADIIKQAMITIDRAIRDRGLQSRMILQVHDELVFNVVPGELPQLQPLVEELMEAAYKGKVRLEVSSGVASNWLEAH